MSFLYVREYYKVPAEVGRRVEIDGKPGIIAEDRGNYIGVNLDADKPGVVRNFHPTCGVVYLGMGVVRKMTRSQENYRRFLRSDSGCSFGEWMRFRRARP